MDCPILSQRQRTQTPRNNESTYLLHFVTYYPFGKNNFIGILSSYTRIKRFAEFWDHVLYSMFNWTGCLRCSGAGCVYLGGDHHYVDE